MPSNLMLHYETVRVCPVCYNVYQCLDWARGLLQGAKEAAKEKEIRQNKRLMSDSMDLQSSTIEIGIKPTTASPSASPGRTRSRGRSRKDLRSSSMKELNAKPTWKSQVSSNQDRKLKRSELAVLDNYVRGKSNSLAADKSRSSYTSSPPRGRSQSPERINQSQSISTNQESQAELYVGQILLACSDFELGQSVQSILIESGYYVHWYKEGRMATNEISEHWDKYDCIIVERDLPLMNAFDVAKAIRDYEKKLRLEKSLKAQKSGNSESGKFLNHRIPVIVYTAQTSPSDLTSYMKADMDGCLSQPVDRMSLINTMRAAIPHHLAPIVKPEVALDEIKRSQKIQKIGHQTGEIRHMLKHVVRVNAL